MEVNASSIEIRHDGQEVDFVVLFLCPVCEREWHILGAEVERGLLKKECSCKQVTFVVTPDQVSLGLGRVNSARRALNELREMGGC